MAMTAGVAVRACRSTTAVLEILLKFTQLLEAATTNLAGQVWIKGGSIFMGVPQIDGL